MMARVRVSVVVPSYKRPTSLERCLSALAAQDTLPDEMLVVARRGDLATQRVVDQYADRLVRLVLVDVSAGRPGLVAALNAGVAASSGQIVCFTDDDAVPRADWLTRIIAAFVHDASIGAVGGRDWVVQDGEVDAGAESVVGTMTWYGRLVGNHHLGVGPPRDVAVLKGANLSVRGELLRQFGFDTRLRGASTEHYSELGLCLRIIRSGYRVVYDPAIAVEHYPQPRADEARDFNATQVRDAAYNETLALLEHLKPAGRVAHLFFAAIVGTRTSPGVVRWMRAVGSGTGPQAGFVVANLTGRGLAISTYVRTHTNGRDSFGGGGRGGHHN
jgi:GT2 family glycosyltransferase